MNLSKLAVWSFIFGWLTILLQIIFFESDYFLILGVVGFSFFVISTITIHIEIKRKEKGE